MSKLNWNLSSKGRYWEYHRGSFKWTGAKGYRRTIPGAYRLALWLRKCWLWLAVNCGLDNQPLLLSISFRVWNLKIPEVSGAKLMTCYDPKHQPWNNEAFLVSITCYVAIFCFFESTRRKRPRGRRTSLEWWLQHCRSFCLQKHPRTFQQQNRLKQTVVGCSSTQFLSQPPFSGFIQLLRSKIVEQGMQDLSDKVLTEAATWGTQKVAMLNPRIHQKLQL